MPLFHQLITAPNAKPEQWIFFLHGILGTGTNWRTFARRWVEAHPSWGAVLVDLRMHGASQDFEGPHTVRAAADDLLALEKEIPGPVRGILGHSFGGKVTLQYLALRGEQLTFAVLFDSNPGSRVTAQGSEDTLNVLEVLRKVAPVLESKSAFISALKDEGISKMTAEWLAMNLEPAEGGGVQFGLDLRAIGDLLDDYFTVDLWPVIEQLPPGVRLDVVVAQRSQVFSAEARERLARLAEKNPRLHVHTLPAGHWVHVDDPEGVFRVVDEAIRAGS